MKVPLLNSFKLPHHKTSPTIHQEFAFTASVPHASIFYMRTIKSLHLAFGIGGIFIFVLTGQYMEIVLHGLIEMPDKPRLLYRTSHIYLMWSSLLNLTLGFYFVAAELRAARVAQLLASVALLAGPPLLLLGFALEAHMSGMSRPFCGVANYLALGGTIVHLLASRRTALDANDGFVEKY
jgi:hypothetical protein